MDQYKAGAAIAFMVFAAWPQAAMASKFSDCLKQALKTGIQLTDCMLAPSGGNPGSAPAPGGQGQPQPYGQGQAQPPRQYVCDISAEPKQYGDWSFQACLLGGSDAVPGIQCVCRSAATGRSYGGTARPASN